jgi:predicted nucleic acid-binding protein
VSPLELVIDASVGIKLYVEEELSHEAEQLFRELTKAPAARFFVPDLFFLECANILWKYVRRFNHDPVQARKDIVSLRTLPLRTLAVADLSELSLDLALEKGVSVYDASYAVLAGSLHIPMMTADRKLIGKLEASGVEMRWLGDFLRLPAG